MSLLTRFTKTKLYYHQFNTFSSIAKNRLERKRRQEMKTVEKKLEVSEMIQSEIIPEIEKNDKPIKITKPIKPTGQYIYGANVVYNALKYNKRAFYHRLFVCPPLLQYSKELNTNIQQFRNTQYNKIKSLCNELDIPIEYCDKSEFHNFFGNRKHEGYILDCDELVFNKINDIQLDKNIYILFENIFDEKYIGNIIRCGNYFNIGGIIYANKINVLSNNLISNYANGAMDEMNIFGIENNEVNEFIKNNQDKYVFIGLKSFINEDNHPKLIDLRHFSELKKTDFKNKGIILCIGDELKGLKDNILNECEYLININGYNNNNPLSLSCLASIILSDLVLT